MSFLLYQKLSVPSIPFFTGFLRDKTCAFPFFYCLQFFLIINPDLFGLGIFLKPEPESFTPFKIDLQIPRGDLYFVPPAF